MPVPERHVLAVDLGGTKTTAAVVTISGDGGGATVLRHRTVPTPAREGAATVTATALDLAASVRGETVCEAVGIATAGVVDTDRGLITHATDALPGWAGTELGARAAERLGAPVALLNDVHAHGLGEARFGVGRGRSSLLLLAVGTGIGGCHVQQGVPMVGGRGAAGHAGHLPVPEAEGVPCPCGREGHLEGLASGPGILALAERLGARGADGLPHADGASLAAAARADASSLAAEAYRVAGYATGRVLGGLLNTLDPDVVALTGGVVQSDGPWRAALAEGVAHDAMDVVAAAPVLEADAGVHAALLGAAAWALDRR